MKTTHVSSWLRKISLYYHTARYLRLRQIAFRIWRKIRHPKPCLRPVPGLRNHSDRWAAPIEKPVSMLAVDRFRFLNREHVLGSARDWNHPEWPKLWLYNLHYFDYLNVNAKDAEILKAWRSRLIRRWIAENPPGKGIGWEPYPLSLRVVNWIKWSLAGNRLSGEAVQNLAVQVRLLRRQLEYHLLGNHLLANGKALVFSGLFFEGREARAWLRKGLDIVAGEISEQILSDGGNFERSPMYHAIVLEDLLDLVNLFRTYGLEVPFAWEDVCIRMRAWLKAMTHPDGGIALFNDAAFGVALTWTELNDYAGRLGLVRQEYLPRPVTRFPETGYVRCERGEAVALLDVAPIGADYIPGHAHADTLGFELSLFGQRVMVDSGTSTYDKNEERQRQRGTAAHNTVTIDGQNSSEVWGGFRVARRARPFGYEMQEIDGRIRVACSHDGYRRLRGKPIHRREWSLGEHDLRVRDTVEGKFREAVVRYHFHPDVHVALVTAGGGRCVLPEGQSITFQVGKGFARLAETTWHPEFNVSLNNCCLEVVFDGADAEVTFNF